jgi:RsmE family RNA methyltransferase
VNLLLVRPEELDANGHVRIADDRARHLREVLHVEMGQAIRAGVLDGAVGTATVAAIDGEAVTLALDGLGETPPRARLDLLLCLPRPKVLARLFSPLAQLGVDRLHLSGAWRVERCYFDAHMLAPEAHLPLLVEGLAQAKDTRLPRVSVHRSFAWLVRTELGAPTADTLRLYADPGVARSPRAAIDAWSERARGRVVLAIGPEGGFTDRERRELAAAGFEPVSLGPRTLRTDVATIALVALVHDALEA